MTERYSKKTSRSRRKPSHEVKAGLLKIDSPGTRRSVQLSLPLPEILADLNDAVEQLSTEAGLSIMRTLLDEEIHERVGDRYAHRDERSANR